MPATVLRRFVSDQKSISFEFKRPKKNCPATGYRMFCENAHTNMTFNATYEFDAELATCNSLESNTNYLVVSETYDLIGKKKILQYNNKYTSKHFFYSIFNINHFNFVLKYYIRGRAGSYKFNKI